MTKERRRWKRLAKYLAAAVIAYGAIAYFLVPNVWRWAEHRHPALDNAPTITHTKAGIPGDPLNVALVGSRDDVESIMKAAGWFPADPLGLRSDLTIAADTVLKRPDNQAPVSNLFLFGRKEDLAFEKPAGDSPRKRNHVRFWRVDELEDGRPVWIGAATFDRAVGFSHTTGQITHHIAADVDAERDNLFADLKATGLLAQTDAIDGFQEERAGRNGGGDPWRTDGRLFVGVIRK
jgi:hypothetical protein